MINTTNVQPHVQRSSDCFGHPAHPSSVLLTVSAKMKITFSVALVTLGVAYATVIPIRRQDAGVPVEFFDPAADPASGVTRVPDEYIVVLAEGYSIQKHFDT